MLGTAGEQAEIQPTLQIIIAEGAFVSGGYQRVAITINSRNRSILDDMHCLLTGSARQDLSALDLRPVRALA